MKIQAEIQALKQISIMQYLASKDITPTSKINVWLMYHSPLREDKNPSFGVNPVTNNFNDLASGDKGTIIDLVMRLEKVNFTDACKFLESFSCVEKNKNPKNSFFLHSQTFDNSPNTLRIDHIKPLQSNALITYCESRKIPFQIAFKFLHEVHYTNNGKPYFSLGFKNDKGGFELRNQYFKGCTAPKGITTIEGENSKGIYLFEGFFDFLSALSFFGTSKPINTVVVLNSLVNLPQAKETLRRAEIVHCFLDRDKHGINAVEKLVSEGFDVLDRSKIYNGYKDFNEYVVSNTLK
jgi:Toprim-like/CHC2 zinc finger